MKRCSKCREMLARDRFCANRARYDGLDVYCRACKQSDRARREQEYRQQALESLGGACAHCGIDDLRVLCIDHVDGGGTQERKAGGPRQYTFYRAVIEDGSRFQALCWNCNWIKRLEHDTPTYAKDSMTFTLTPS